MYICTYILLFLFYVFMYVWVLNLRGSRNLGNITGQFLAHSSTFTARISRVVADVQAPDGESGNF